MLHIANFTRAFSLQKWSKTRAPNKECLYLHKAVALCAPRWFLLSSQRFTSWSLLETLQVCQCVFMRWDVHCRPCMHIAWREYDMLFIWYLCLRLIWTGLHSIWPKVLEGESFLLRHWKSRTNYNFHFCLSGLNAFWSCTFLQIFHPVSSWNW